MKCHGQLVAVALYVVGGLTPSFGAEAFLPRCRGKRVSARSSIHMEAPVAGRPLARTLDLTLTFCDGSTATHALDTTDAAWILPGWSKVDIDPGAAEAGAILSARAHDSHGQINLRVVPRPGFLSVLRALRPWRPAREGAEGVGPIDYVEIRRLPIPDGAQVQLTPDKLGK